MSRPADYLYNLLPATYRTRDAEQGYPLRELLAVMDEQGALVEANIDALYGNWFIETAQDWAVPYIAELVGYQPVHDAGRPGSGPGSAARNKVLMPRREAAHTINFRRRKGTLALLEQLSLESAGWEAVAVEGFRLLGWNQHLNHPHLDRGGTADLRNGPALSLLGGPGDTTAHCVDVRRPDSHRTTGRFNIPDISLFAAPLVSHSITDAPACCVEKEGSQCFTFSVLGHDTPLFTQPPDPSGAGDPALHLPQPVSRAAFTALVGRHPPKARASASYLGEGKSLAVTAWGWRGGARHDLVAADVIPANLSDWHAYKAPRNKVLIDPERGRLVFPAGQLPRGVTVGYHYGFSMDLGGGEYPRQTSQPAGSAVYRVRKESPRKGEFGSIMGAYGRWRKDRRTPGWPMAGVIEVMDSRAYEERFEFTLAQGEYLQLRAADGARPVLRLLDYRVDQPDPLSVTGGNGSRFVLDGLLVVGRGLVVNGPGARRGAGDGDDPTGGGELCDVTIRHCTLVPGWNLDCDCEPQRPDEPSILLDGSRAAVRISRSILGPVQVRRDPDNGQAPMLALTDCLWDATDPCKQVLCDEVGGTAFSSLCVQRCTVIGQVCVHELTLGEDSIFLGELAVARRQLGCVRFCYLPLASRTPRRFNCQPDLVQDAARAAHPGNPADAAAAAEREAMRVRPALSSRRYGNPNYGRLAAGTAAEIVRGASDESEMGVFHDLFEPQRAANLRARLEEYTVAGFSTGIIFTS
ncbi:hypothetical protein [Arthrobacter sp. HY1533]|uniref:hypothetical protein n=1 Tax=Arthrobacter sp. HY1533 TaxID=2970919 RepID=UPI0022B9FBDF|nr:hypothetical protein [Arthrobacter sp. HY1533]